MKLSEIIDFPKEKELNWKGDDFLGTITYERAVGYNQALKECDVEVELDVEKLVELVKNTRKDHEIPTSTETEYFVELDIFFDEDLAKAIADNLPNLLRRKE